MSKENIQMQNRADKNSNLLLLGLVAPVIIIWGCNFAVMRVGVHETGPFLLATLRFFIASIPLIFFIKKPKVPFYFIAVYGITFGLGQFGFLFTAIKLGLPSGMASLIVQLQVVFTPIFALIFLNQRIFATTILGTITSLIGLVIILSTPSNTELSTPSNTEIIPLFLGVMAAMSWGASNVVIAWGASRNYAYNPVALVIWASALLPAPFLLAAGITGELTNIRFERLIPALLPAFYLGAIATVIAYYFWVKALSLFPTSSVAPFSLLIPVIGIALGYVIFGETLSTTEIAGCAFIIFGVIIHMYSLSKRKT